ncbi:lipopolysaccharide biosynthesis protein [Chelatococcus sp. SYSU_G07232]|uniref:Lipopolysaccharide biosynthesis protein n=1 Tax=Chelatococcus albus TaxID=3047466 RepID=A0ABT7AEV7_9HYPH|nr:lipopolysaccharide biosynthesis protein [Chelatococcus sp. SYSU_G07232]MDJ1157907.1 lipopolysaccharide biosynthesis protein [Chelatococcus sp. SYSU_G07232]
MAIILTFMVNTGLNFVLGLIVAKFLGPDEFGRYAIALAVGTVLNTALFDWLRLSATRFYSERTRAEQPAVRATLDTTFAGFAGILVVTAGLVAALGFDLALTTPVLLAAVGMGICNALFDYHAALARSRFLERGYMLFVLVKNAAAFVLMIGAAYLFRDAALVGAGLCLSVGLALVVIRPALADPHLSPRLADRALMLRFARYGLPLVLANVVYQLLPLANRAFAAAHYGYGEAGQFSLAADLGVRIFAAVGSALDILLFQLAVRKDEEDGRAAAERQIAQNMAVVALLLMPLAAGYWLMLPAFEALVVPEPFRGTFSAYSTLLIPALFAFAVTQYALNPIFQLEKATAPVTSAALVALAVDLALVAVLPQRYGPISLAMAQSGGMLAGLLVLAGLAARRTRTRPPVKDLLATLAATTLMAMVLFPLRGREPHLATLIVSLLVGGAAYVGTALAFDVAGIRGLLGRRRGARRPAVPE